MNTLPKTSNYEHSCNRLELPILEQNDEYTLLTGESPITADTAVIEKLCTETVIRQKMHTDTKEHVTGSRVIIDDILLHSTSLSLLMLLFGCYL